MKQKDIITQNISTYLSARTVLNSSRPFPTTTSAHDLINKIESFEGWGRCRKMIDTQSEEYQSAETQLSQYIDSKRQVTRLLHDIQDATLTSFYTPIDVAQCITHYALTAFHQLNGRPARTILDPSAGTGNFLSSLEDIPPLTQVETREKDEITRTILQARLKAMQYIKPFSCSSQGTTFENNEHSAYDIITSNIPFGDIRVHDTTGFTKQGGIYRQCQQRIHNYYFLKSMHELNDGGILAFITSRGFLSSRDNAPYRNEMLKYGRILNIVRLPDNMFNTIEAGTDLIVYQRREGKAGPLDKIFAEGWPEGEFLDDHKECYLSLDVTDCADLGFKKVPKIRKNQYGKDTYHYKYIGADLSKDLTHMLSIPLASNPAKSNPHDPPKPEPTPHNPMKLISKSHPHSTIPPSPSLTPSASPLMAMSPSTLGIFSLLANPHATTAQSIGCMQGMIQCLTMLYPQLTDANRHIFKSMYDSFLAVNSCNLGRTFTDIHDIVKHAGTHLTPDQANFLTSLEKKEGGNWVPADIFTRNVTRKYTGRLTPEEALASSLNEYGRVNVPYMEQRTSMDITDIADELSEQMFFNPIEGIYEEADQWLTGNVVRKAREAEQALHRWKNGERLAAEHALAALKTARPAAIPFNDIDVGFGARWVPIEYFEQFIRQTCMLTDNWAWRGLKYVPQTDQYVGQFYVPWKCPYAREWKVKQRGADEMIIDAMHDTIHKFTIEDDNGTKVPDKESMMQAAKIVQQIRTRWTEWINSPEQSDARSRIEEIYNERFNCEVRPKYDGSFQTFPGLHLENLGIESLYESQKDAIWMIKRNYGGVCWHEVGTGKTLIMCISAYEMKRIGLVQKPLIIGMKANIAQIADTFRKAYPEAKLLYPTKTDFSQKNRHDLFNQIRNNDWDCIIMSHDQFGFLPEAGQTEQDLMQEEIDGLNDVLNDMDRTSHFYGRVLSGLQKRKQNMEIKLQDMREKIAKRKDHVPDFSELGIDFIQVDESHVFKNLQFSTRNERVAGIGNPQGSQRAWKLLTAIRDIQRRKNRDVCAGFYSGTVVSNSLTELYIIFKYLRPRALADQNIHSFDAWAANYCERKTDYEMNIVGQVQMKERFSAYINVPELSQFFRQITDYRTSKMCGVDVPDMEQHFDCTPPTRQQAIMLDRLQQFVTTGSWSKLKIQREAPKNLDKALMLVATNIARQTSLDCRLLDNCRTFSDEPGNKVRRCVNNICDIYSETYDQKGTQFVFTDIGTLDDTKWNLQQEVHDLLVKEKGIPESEIAFINDATTDAKRLSLFDKMNRGEVRILIGSTTKLGTGVNAQERAVAVHHLDIPWRPADLEQRNGRAVRKGNWLAKQRGKVDIYIYGSERTLDAYKFSLLTVKQKFIDQINRGTIGLRRVDGSILDDGEGSVGYAELLSIVSGNTDLLDKARLDARIMALEKDRKTFYTQRNQAVATIAQFKADNLTDEQWLRQARHDLKSPALTDAARTRLSQKIATTSQAIASRLEQLPALDTIRSREWDGNDILNRLKSDLTALEARIARSMKKDKAA